MQIFIIWSNYDGANIDEYDSIEAAEIAAAEIMAKEDDDNYGTTLMAIIKGKELVFSVIETVSKVKIADQ